MEKDHMLSSQGRLSQLIKELPEERRIIFSDCCTMHRYGYLKISIFSRSMPIKPSFTKEILLTASISYWTERCARWITAL